MSSFSNSKFVLGLVSKGVQASLKTKGERILKEKKRKTKP
jgi:hypothetical protein